MTGPLERWTEARANAWYDAQPWRVGCNFLPSTAINQMEMFGADTFDPETLDRELGWASAIGFDTLRVYLHDLAWQLDPAGFLDRLDHFLTLTERHGICPLLVFFDDCWFEPHTGPLPTPRPGVHNSGWFQSPGREALAEPGCMARLEDYVSAVLARFGQDPRVLAWDMFNEVTNNFLPILSLPEAERRAREAELRAQQEAWNERALALLEASFAWARAMGPAQPLTAGIWMDDAALNEKLANLSDVISFHHYRSGASLERQIQRLRVHGRPLLCTEYLARTTGCTFETHLPVFQRERVACWNWGLVDGKSQTKYAWTERLDGEPEVWFHDIFHADGRPWRTAEVELIKRLTAR